MIRIRHGNSDAEVSGTVAELRAIAEQLKTFADSETKVFPADTTGSPAPYDRFLLALEVRADGELMQVHKLGDTLMVAGSPDRISAFASWCWFSEQAKRGHHSHYESSTNSDIADDSLPLVIAVC